jgi:hypothetical protein
MDGPAMSLYTRHLERPFDRPVLVMCLEGWIDAGLGAAAALASVLSGRTMERVASWDGDELIDSRARRPVLHIADGVVTGMTWPAIELQAGTDDAGRDFLALSGPEPDMRWEAFSRSVVELVTALGVRQVVGLGAFPAPVPHTRPVHLVSTAPNRRLAAEIGFVSGSIDVPAGMQAVLEAALNAAGIPAVGLWARVPHYVVSMPYPAASAALVDGLVSVAGLSFSTGELHDSATRARLRIDELIANSDEHRAMVSQLEAQVDGETRARGANQPAGEGGARSGPTELDPHSLPSGDEIAAELERYLRGDGAP